MMEEAAVVTDESYDYDSFDEQNSDRPAERWAPLGAATSPDPPHTEDCFSHPSEAEQLQMLEEEQEQLNSSLLALTTHFAQVQFRLKQIVSAAPENKEELLKELEEFAFKGIPDVRGSRVQDAQILEEMSEKEHEIKMNEQREKQRNLIQQLKTQLEDLETYAYETGEAELPTNQLMEKQKVVIDQLTNKLDMELENINKLSTEELRQVVDRAVGHIVNPVKVKEKLVEQLRTQITDLERFIEFLQDEASSPGPLGKERCTCPVHHKFRDDASDGGKECCVPNNYRPSLTEKDTKGKLSPPASIIKRTLSILQMFIITQFGCGGRDFQKNLLKKTTKGNHWGDLRARLEVSIDKVLKHAQEQQDQEDKCTEYSSDSEESEELSSPALTQAVRKDFAMALRDLVEHGLMEVGQSKSVVPWGCLPSRSSNAPIMMHAWDLIAKYYEMKHGREYNETPARMLSQSFDLEIVGGKPITSKQTLLGAISSVSSSHAPLKRSEDSHFKAFVCTALNEKKISMWLKLIFRSQLLIDNYYQDWSYVARTGFDDALKSLDKFNSINFNLPVDLAVRPFSNIRDAF